MLRPHLVIAGGSGFLGRTAVKNWSSDWDLTVLSRRRLQVPGARVVRWDGRSVGEWRSVLDGATALLNLAGRSVDCRYDARNRRSILDSRVLSTRALGEAIRSVDAPPSVWLNASTATIYRHAYDRPMDEATGEIGVGFSVDVARAWEETLHESETPSTRKLALRSSFVLGSGGPLAVLSRLTRLGLGGAQGPGHQFISWIHALDWLRAISFLIEKRELSGTFNLTAPNPISNSEFMSTLRRVCRVPFGIPTPTPLLRLGAFFLRTEPELILKSRRVVPTRLHDTGFNFQFPELLGALEHLLGSKRPLAEWESRSHPTALWSPK